MIAHLLFAAALALSSPTEVTVPSPAGSAEPFLFADSKGGLLFSWIEPADGKSVAIRFARYAGGKWSAPRTIASGSDFFVNWADFPSVVADARGTLYAHWLQKSGGDTYAYDVRYSVSSDGGATWSAPALLNRDGKKVEHGFASLVPLRGGGVGAVWLDGRNMVEGKEEGEMTIRYAAIDARGKLTSEAVLDERVCECCTTGMTLAKSGLVAAYRDRTADEIRDISFLAQNASGWTKPASLNRDNWKINGCPVNGPQLDARGNGVAAAWFTAGNNQAQVSAAFSANGGKTFGKPIRVDGGTPAGRVDVLAVAPDAAVVVWLEAGAAPQIVARRVAANGALGPIVKLGETSNARSAGFPRAALVGSTAYVAWTDPGTPKRIRIVRFEAR